MNIYKYTFKFLGTLGLLFFANLPAWPCVPGFKHNNPELHIPFVKNECVYYDGYATGYIAGGNYEGYHISDVLIPGLRELSKNNPVGALQLWRQVLENKQGVYGGREAAFNIAVMHYKGVGVRADYVMALKYAEISGSIVRFYSITQALKIKIVQEALIGMGLLSGRIDGDRGPKTNAAINRALSDHGSLIPESASNASDLLKVAEIANRFKFAEKPQKYTDSNIEVQAATSSTTTDLFKRDLIEAEQARERARLNAEKQRQEREAEQERERKRLAEAEAERARLAERQRLELETANERERQRVAALAAERARLAEEVAREHRARDAQVQIGPIQAVFPPGTEKRVALVIGNAAYSDRPLRNPVNDAQLMQATLQELGFQVQVATDVDRRGLLAALRDFEARARGAEVALFYFAGHGAQVGGANYLIPVNAQIRSETDVPDEALDAASVLRRIEEGRARVGLVILDACRDNPYPGANRSNARGLARMSAPTGTIVAYATAPGSTADDGGSGPNGLYTGALVRYLATPGLDIKEVFDRTAQEVERLSNGRQRPREEIGLRGRYVLRDAATLAAAPAAAVMPTPLPQGQAGGVSLADLEREQQARQAWAAWQQRMQGDFDRIAAFSGAVDLREQAWQRFLEAWKDDNPTSDQDEELRRRASEAVETARREARRLAAARPSSISRPVLEHRVKPEPLKAAWIYVGPVGDAGWSFAHDQGRKAVEARFGDAVKTTFVERVPEGAGAEVVIRDLVKQGNKIIFATSFGYMDAMLKVASEFPGVKFEHATGYKTAPNMRIYDARFYEDSYMAGIIAGKMTKTDVLGFVGSFPIPEVLRNINAYTLGAQSVNPKIRTKVVWVNTWFDPPKESEAAQSLINAGADVLLQNTDSTAVLQTAEKNGKYAFGWDSDMSAFGPKAHLASAAARWGSYYITAIEEVLTGTWKTVRTVWGVRQGVNGLATISSTVPKDVTARVEAIRAELEVGRFEIFTGPIIDNAGRIRLGRDQKADQAWKDSVNFYVKGVEGRVPSVK